MDEQLFQLIWSELAFETQDLKTIDGDPVSIISPGQQNQGDGPDFHDGIIAINDISFYGDIELHISARNWFLHNHHQDPRYNRVVLHVVLQNDDLCQVTRQDGTRPATLVLKPFLSGKILQIFKKKFSPSLLPCHGLVRSIPENIKKSQWIHAQNEYFDNKINYLLTFYSDDQPPSMAWKNMFTAGLFDGLGIMNNRSSMVRLHNLLLESQELKSNSLQEIIRLALSFSGISEEEFPKMKRTDWDFSSCRPPNQPDVRIPQACMLLYNIRNLSFESFLNDDIRELWSGIISTDTPSLHIGNERSRILKYTVFLPAMYLIGNLFLIEQRKQQAFNFWNNNTIKVPDKIRKKYSLPDFSEAINKYPAGTIYQYKHYCKTGRCADCKLMKYILKS